MKHIKMYENFLSPNVGRHSQHRLSLNEARSRFDPETGTIRMILSSGERAALNRNRQILDDAQLFGAYLMALDEYERKNYIERIPGINNYKKSSSGRGRISDLDLAIALNYEKVDTLLLDKDKFISLMKGNKSFANRKIDEKRLEIFEVLKEFKPEEIISVVSRLVQDKSLPRILNKETYVKRLENESIFRFIEDYIRAKKSQKDKTPFRSFPGDEQWIKDLAPAIDRAAAVYNKESDEIIAIYQEKLKQREKYKNSESYRPARRN